MAADATADAAADAALLKAGSATAGNSAARGAAGRLVRVFVVVAPPADDVAAAGADSAARQVFLHNRRRLGALDSGSSSASPVGFPTC